MLKKSLTKFMNFRVETFIKPRLKISLPIEFNDPFDSQLRLNDEYYTKIAQKTGKEIDELKYYSLRLQSCHILSLSAISPIDISSSHMWGLYANSGSGIAFEFDYSEVKEMVLFESLIKFLEELNKINKDQDKITYIQTNLTDKIFIQIQKVNDEFLNLNNTKTTNSGIVTIDHPVRDELPLLAFQTSLNKLTKNDVVLQRNCYLLLKMLKDNFFKTMINNRFNMFNVRYQDDFQYLEKIFTDYWKTPKEFRNINKISEFMTVKTKNWKAENEVRVINYTYNGNIIVDLDRKIKNKEITFEKAYEELNKRCNTEMKFIDFSKEFKISAIKSNVSLLNDDYLFLPIPHLPFPKRIYLGWSFDYNSLNGKENLKIIIDYCKKYEIDLFHINKLLSNDNPSLFSTTQIYKVNKN